MIRVHILPRLIKSYKFIPIDSHRKLCNYGALIVSGQVEFVALQVGSSVTSCRQVEGAVQVMWRQAFPLHTNRKWLQLKPPRKTEVWKSFWRLSPRARRCRCRPGWLCFSSSSPASSSGSLKNKTDLRRVSWHPFVSGLGVGVNSPSSCSVVTRPRATMKAIFCNRRRRVTSWFHQSSSCWVWIIKLIHLWVLLLLLLLRGFYGGSLRWREVSRGPIRVAGGLWLDYYHLETNKKKALKLTAHASKNHRYEYI